MKKKILGISIILMLVAMLVLLTGCGEQKQNVLESEKDAKNESKEVFYGCKAIDGDGTNVGDVITLAGEEFYVISNDGTNIKMLAKYNLYVGGYRDKENRNQINEYSEGENTGIQNSKMIGGGNEEERIDGITQFSDSQTHGKTDGDYEGSIAEKYVNDYLKYLIEKAKLDSNNVSATLITVDELESLGCSKIDGNCSNAPEWVYNTSYWTKSKKVYNGKESEGTLWVISRNGKLQEAPNVANYLGVRPVITIPVSVLEK